MKDKIDWRPFIKEKELIKKEHKGLYNIIKIIIFTFVLYLIIKII